MDADEMEDCFDRLICYAFKIVVQSKLVEDGYFDFGRYVYSPKERFHPSKRNEKDNIPKSYRDMMEMPPRKFTMDMFGKLLQISIKTEYDDCSFMSFREAEYILSMALKKVKRAKIKHYLLQLIRECIQDKKVSYAFYEKDENHNSYIVYDKKLITIHIVRSITDFLQIKSQLSNTVNSKLYYRGHADLNYRLIPGIYRKNSENPYYISEYNSKLKSHEAGYHTLDAYEYDMYYTIQEKCADDFKDCHSNFEKLVKMQHYGLPTRLLDISTNPLCAMYFACSMESYMGEIVLLTDKEVMSYNFADEQVENLARLATVKTQDKEILLESLQKMGKEAEINISFEQQMENINILEKYFGNISGYFASESMDIRIEYIKRIINEIGYSFIVKAKRDNQRIINQSGDFVIFGLGEKSAAHLRFKNAKDQNRRPILLIPDNYKKRIISELSSMGIERSFIYPELEDVSVWMRDVYSKDPASAHNGSEVVSPIRLGL